MLIDEIARLRVERIAHSQERIMSSFRYIFEEENPMFIEKQFEKTRWDFLEQEEFFNRFDINWLAIYLLKLQILHRLKNFDKTKGAENFEHL